jgi:hypothetical protein
MTDIFDHKILCHKCDAEMCRGEIIRNGFRLRTLICPNGHDKLIHPADEEEYRRFKELRGKEFKVKMRIVGNSYAVSIPKEIVSFMRELDQRFVVRSKIDNMEREQEKIMDDMVRLCFEDAKRLSLNFGDFE